MALIKCPECGGKISTISKFCIHCGCPMSEILKIKEKESKTNTHSKKKSKNTKSKPKKREKLFNSLVNQDERKILSQFRQLCKEYLSDHKLIITKTTYGFALPVDSTSDEEPKRRAWISRNKKKKLTLRFKKEINSSVTVLPLTTKRKIDEAFRELKVAFSKASHTVDDFANRIKAKDTFSEYTTTNVKEIKLMPHQKAGVELAGIYNRFAFFYDTGTGKTIMSLEIMMNKHKQDGARFLVVAPKPLIKTAWMDDSLYFPQMRLLPLSKNMIAEDYAVIYDRWEVAEGRPKKFTDEDGLFLDDRRDLKRCLSDLKNELIQRADHFIINIDSIRTPKEINDLFAEIGKCDGLIIDESTVIKNYSSKSAVRMRAVAKKMKYVYILSGKPAPNSSIEYFSQMVIVDPETFNISFNSFVTKYYKRVGKSRLVDKNNHTRKEVAKMVANRSIIIQKEDCADLNLKEAFSNRVEVELDSSTKEFYSDVMNNFMTEIIDMEGKKIQVQPLSRLASIMKLREIASGFYLDRSNSHRINNNKVEVVKRLIEKIGFDKTGKRNKIIIWCTFKFEIQTLESKLKQAGYKVVTCYSENRKDQDTNIAAFKHGDAEIMIAHPQTLGKGASFVKCHYCIFSSMSYSNEQYYQAHDRIYRKGQKEICNFYHLLTESTIDEVIYKCVMEKANSAKLFERLVKSASRFGWSKNDVEYAKHADEEIVKAATGKLIIRKDNPQSI